MIDRVIVRAFGGEPVALVEIGRTEKLVYVSSEKSLPRIERGESQPVGVPKEDVFQFDQVTFDSLSESWVSGGIEDAWAKLVSRG